ncbi:MAG: cytochrome oxidase putative small subunit CydP [Thiohalorhabdus sp.]|uniref:cytochrome oxidase putative small subunit CydP n=1 Tax=Thiohalorhabdus sp. TaxID=3094134 RepID=UPI0039814A8F
MFSPQSCRLPVRVRSGGGSSGRCPATRRLSAKDSQDPLLKELAVVLLVKVGVLGALWLAFFSGPEQGGSPADVADRFLPSGAAPTQTDADRK